MLFHRSGTLWEDMYWIDGETCEIVANSLNEKIEKQIGYKDSICRLISKKDNLITMHTHPNSMPPSVADFNSCYRHNYKECLIICHNGVIYRYKSNQEVSLELYEMYVKKFMYKGYSEIEAQINALEKIEENHKIVFQEVK